MAFSRLNTSQANTSMQANTAIEATAAMVSPINCPLVSKPSPNASTTTLAIHAHTCATARRLRSIAGCR